jgi:hypothetical protein
VATVRAPERIGAWRAFVSGTRLFFRRFVRVMMVWILPVVIAAGLALAVVAWRARSQQLWLGAFLPLLFAWSRTARLAALRATLANL